MENLGWWWQRLAEAFTTMRIAIVGAGWAGCAAAYAASSLGMQTVVFEAAPIPGGRARKHLSKALNLTIDNGQHLLIGAYEQTLTLIQNLGLAPEHAFYRFPLDLQSADGSFRLRARPYPAPLHLASALFSAIGLSWSERWSLIRLHTYLRRLQWKTPAGWHVEQLLTHTKQPLSLIEKMWLPLCVGALNTPIDQACAQLFSHVLRDSLGGPTSHSDMLIPRVNMTDLWATKALSKADLRVGHTVRELALTNDQHVLVDGIEFDHIILATNAPSAHRLLQNLAHTKAQDSFLNTIKQLRYNPIATLYLEPESAWNAPFPLLMLAEKMSGLEAGQWVFNHGAIANSQLKHTIAVTISCAQRLIGIDKATVTAAIIEQINSQSRWPLPAIIRSELIIEKRATFSAEPRLHRPSHLTPWPRIHLAGDWTNSPYPAVLEAAVQSGLHAVEKIKAH